MTQYVCGATAIEAIVASGLELPHLEHELKLLSCRMGFGAFRFDAVLLTFYHVSEFTHFLLKICSRAGN